MAIPGLAALLICACAETPPAEANKHAEQSEEVPTVQPAPVLVSVVAITLEDFFVLQQSSAVMVYDVRPAFFHAMGHIPGSVSWPISTYAKQLASREPEIRAAIRDNRPVVLYCADTACPDARNMAGWLAARGHHIRYLMGGWEAWKSAGLPTS